MDITQGCSRQILKGYFGIPDNCPLRPISVSGVVHMAHRMFPQHLLENLNVQHFKVTKVFVVKSTEHEHELNLRLETIRNTYVVSIPQECLVDGDINRIRSMLASAMTELLVVSGIDYKEELRKQAHAE